MVIQTVVVQFIAHFVLTKLKFNLLNFNITIIENLFIKFSGELMHCFFGGSF